MAVLTLAWKTEIGREELRILEAGAKARKYSCVNDGRVNDKTHEVGPVVYTEPQKKDVDGNLLDPTGAIFMWFDDDDAESMYTFLTGQSSVDISDTINNYFTTTGADVASMLTKRPVV